MKVRQWIYIFRSHALFALFALNLSASAIAQEERNIKPHTAEKDSVLLSGKIFALVVGVSEYTNGWNRLPNAVMDAREVAAVLEKQGFQVTKKENPTSLEFDGALKDFFDRDRWSQNDRLLFYFAGHGYSDITFQNIMIGYVVPADAPRPDVKGSGFTRYAISMADFVRYSEETNNRHILFVFDSCFSGSLFTRYRALNPSIIYVANKPVRQFITAGDENESVPDVSIFKREFIKGIKGHADNNRDGFITGTELGEYLYYEVVQLSHEKQHPQYGKLNIRDFDKGEFIFEVREPLPPTTPDTSFVIEPTRNTPLDSIKFGYLEIDSPYIADFYVDGKRVATKEKYWKNILLPNIYYVKIAGLQGYEYKENVFIRDRETVTVTPLRIRSGF